MIIFGRKLFLTFVMAGCSSFAVAGTAMAKDATDPEPAAVAATTADQKPASSDAKAAEPGNDADVACLASPAKLIDAEVTSFTATPSALLTDNPAGGLGLSDRVRALAGSSSRAFPQIMALVKTANPDQKSAIASGLARVVYLCNNLATEAAADYGARIQVAVASLGDAGFASAFQQASNDVKTAAVGPGAGGVSVGGGAIADATDGAAANNKYQYPAEDPQATTSGDYTVGGVSPFSANADILSP